MRRRAWAVGATPMRRLAAALVLLVMSGGMPAPSQASPGDDGQTTFGSAAGGQGYWLAGSTGAVYEFGAAEFRGAPTSAPAGVAPVVALVPTPTGGGYWLVADNGSVLAFGDAGFYGALTGSSLNSPIVGAAATPTGAGYWLVAADGGIFSFGDATFYGSTGAIRLNQPIVGMAATPTGAGYWFVARDGGVFSFGDATFLGSVGGRTLPAPIVGFAAHPTAGALVTGAEPPTSEPSGADPAPAEPAPPSTQPAPPPTTTTTTAPPPSRDPFVIGLIGDTGYTSSGERAVGKIAEHMAEFPLEFVIHVGDIWAEGHSCSDENYLERRGMFNEFAHPFVYTPGDNEWTDCSQSSSGRLRAIREIFFPTSQTLGRHPMTVARQAEMPENARWSHNGIWFATINEPGSAGRGGSHRDRNIEWLEGTFDAAEAANAAGVMIGWQDNPFEPSGGRLLKALKQRTIDFGRPVVLVHGDTHRHRVNQPWDEVPHFTRVEVHGATSSAVWIKATIDPSSPEIFSFDNERD